MIFLETLKEADSEEKTAKTISHEIGHQFGLTHGDFNAINPALSFCNPTIVPTCPHNGIMRSSMNGIPDPAGNDTKFIPQHLNLMRYRTTSPGQ